MFQNIHNNYSVNLPDTKTAAPCGAAAVIASYQTDRYTVIMSFSLASNISSTFFI